MRYNFNKLAPYERNEARKAMSGKQAFSSPDVRTF
jgi:hypothetical protein